MRSFLILIALLGLSLSLPAPAAESLTALYAAVPAPPADLTAALGWVRDGRIAATEVQSLETRLANQKSAFAGAAAGTAVHTSAESQPDSPAVMACVAAYQAYLAANPAGNEAAQVLGRRLSSLAQGYAGLKLKASSSPQLMRDIQQRELSSYAALFADWKAKRNSVVEKAQRELQAAGEPAAIKNADNRAAVQQYQGAMITEIEALFGMTRQAVETAAGLAAAAPAPGRAPSTLWDLMSNPKKKPS